MPDFGKCTTKEKEKNTILRELMLFPRAFLPDLKKMF